jgi:asparagine synthase (glutamine-hydrolysing)
LFDYNQFARDAAAMASELHGFAIRAPLGDRRLLEFLLRVPEPLYRRNGQPRSFARHVLSDRLPPEIISETRSGYQSAGWFRRLSDRRAEIMDELEALQASPLAARIIDLPRLRRLASNWPADEQAAEARKLEFHIVLDRGLHVGRFIRWVEGGNA